MRLENTTILSWHRNEDGTILAYIECLWCGFTEEFVTLEAAVVFGTLHRQSMVHRKNILKTGAKIDGYSTTPALSKRPANRRIIPVPRLPLRR